VPDADWPACLPAFAGAAGAAAPADEDAEVAERVAGYARLAGVSEEAMHRLTGR
jgi:hypothetical protein